MHPIYGQDINQRDYNIENKVVLKALKKYKQSLELAIEEATLKMEANNLWMVLIDDKKEIAKLKKNNKNQIKIIESNKKRISNIQFKNPPSISEPAKFTNREARAIKWLGNIAINNGIESEKIAPIYEQKMIQAREFALENNEEKWLKVAEQWDKIIKKVNEIMIISFTAGEYFFVAAEMIKPGIVVGNDQEGKKEIETLKTQIIQDIIYEDESF